MYIIKLFAIYFVSFVFICTPVYAASEEIQTQHNLQITLRDNLLTEVKHKIKITNNNKYTGITSLDFNESVPNSKIDKYFNVKTFEISNSKDKTSIVFNDALIGPKSEEVGYLYTSNKIFYKKGLNYVLKIPKINDVFMQELRVELYLSPNALKNLPTGLLKFAKKDSQGNTFLELSDDDLNKLSNEITFGNIETYLLSAKHLISKEKPYIIIPASLGKRQITKVYKISKIPNLVYIKDSNLYFEYKNVEKTQFVDAEYLIEITDSPIESKYLETIGSSLLSSRKFWDYKSESLQNTIKEIKNSSNDDFIFNAYNKVLDDLTYNSTNEYFSFVERIGAENINENNKKTAYCLDYTDYLIALLRGLGVKSGEMDGYYFQEDLQDFNVAKLHSWVFYKNNNGEYKELDPTFQDTAGGNYINSFDLSHIILTVKTQSPETPYVFGSYTKDNNYESLKIRAVKDGENNNFYFGKISVLNLFFLKYVNNNTGLEFEGVLPYSYKILTNVQFSKAQDELKNTNVTIQNTNIYSFLFKASYTGFLALVTISPFLAFGLFSVFKKVKSKRNKGKKVNSLID